MRFLWPDIMFSGDVTAGAPHSTTYAPDRSAVPPGCMKRRAWGVTNHLRGSPGMRMETMNGLPAAGRTLAWL
jgi:hypothetical protein